MTITNRLFDEIAVGDRATAKRVCTDNDLFIFANASGNLNPLNLPDRDGDDDPSTPPLAPSMWVGALISNVIGNLLPGPGSLLRAQSLTFGERVVVGDELTISVKVIEKREPDLLVLDTRVEKSTGEMVASGIGEVYAPRKRLVFADISVPEVVVRRHAQFEKLLTMCEHLEPMPTAVVCPHDGPSLDGPLQAAAAGLIIPILIGVRSQIEAAAQQLGKSLNGIEIIESAQDHQAAAIAVQRVLQGHARAVMKGALHTDVLLGQIVKRDGGLRAGRRVSHVWVMDIPGMDHPLFISDAAINIAPDLAAKADITQNAIDLALACGLPTPRVGILSAIETVNPNIPSTLDAAILSKMAERGQIRGGLVDGPLAMDNAVDMQAARTKGITSLVAGRAQVLIVPNLESGNMLAKELIFIAGAESAGLVLGATAPVMLTSRSDDARARLMSCVLAVLHDDWRRRGGKPLPAATPEGDAR